jgi:hypothetical protein
MVVIQLMWYVLAPHRPNFSRTLLTYNNQPTTTIFSSTDEIVQPQSGTNASAYIKDGRHVGVTNNEIQVVCAGGTAGVYATHEGVLYDDLAYNLAIDALTHPGPGQPSRLNLERICNSAASPGLSVSDILATESKCYSNSLSWTSRLRLSPGNIVIALVVEELYFNKVTDEPPIMDYALYWGTPDDFIS